MTVLDSRATTPAPTPARLDLPAQAPTPLADSLAAVLRDASLAAPTDASGLRGPGPDATVTRRLAEVAATAGQMRVSRRDRLATLLHVYELHTSPIEQLGERVRLQHHPVVAGLKQQLEADWLAELAGSALPAGLDSTDVPAAMRTMAARDRLPAVYRWLGHSATWDEVVAFLALEGGPDAGFDDLVAACQVGLHGAAKMELATNYWDEMGDGDPEAVHTTLHERLVDAIDMPRLPETVQPTSALARSAMGGLLATNRWLQPEMLGAMGLIELQAGPRCRLVLQAFDRCGAPRPAYPFYDVHAEVDPRHGRDWLDNAITPTIAEHPQWAERILRGAHWRNVVTNEFFGDVERMLRPSA